MTRNTFPAVGILGGGQLGRMTALAAIRMGVSVRFLVPAASGPVATFANVTVADWTDAEVLRAFAAECTVVTVESEWAPIDLLETVAPSGVRLFPTPATVRIIRDKGIQKTKLQQSGLPVPDFRRCGSLDDARAAVSTFGYPVLVKRYRGSYDGYGNATVRTDNELLAAWDDLAEEDGALIEAWVAFRRELSVLVARREDGEQVVYPVAFTEQRDHRCHAVTVPSGVPPDVEAEARQIGSAAVNAVEGVGIVAVELFETEDGRILINELAPRPHNTGHYTIDACHTSQFENHVRAVLGWPLGDPSLRVQAAAMVNVLGRRDGPLRNEGLTEALSYPGVSVHLYGKEDVRRNRKMGHVNVTGDDVQDILARAEAAAAEILL